MVFEGNSKSKNKTQVPYNSYKELYLIVKTHDKGALRANISS